MIIVIKHNSVMSVHSLPVNVNKTSIKLAYGHVLVIRNTRDVDLMLGQCWFIVYYPGPTLKRLLVYVLMFSGDILRRRFSGCLLLSATVGLRQYKPM